MKYAFFSAANATALQEARREAAAAVDEERQRLQEHAETSATAGYDTAEVVATPAADAEGGEHEDDGSDEDSPAELEEEEYSSDESEESEDGGAFLPIEEGPDAQDPRTRVLSVLELEDLFVNSAPDLSSMCWLSDHI